MENLQQLEILWILFVQGLGSWLAGTMRAISMLGNEEFYLLIMPALYWSFNAGLGFRVAIMLLLSNCFNATFKMLLHGPRPYWIDPQVQALIFESSFGAPSGHAQNAASIWGLLAYYMREKGEKAALIVLIGLIGFSRIYLGVHFISDVLLGFLLGGLLLWAFIRFEPSLSAWLSTRSLAHMLGLALISSLLIVLVVVLPAEGLRGWQIPAEWEVNALAAGPESEISAFNIEGAFTVGGTWLGLMAGIAWLYHRQGGYKVSKTPFQRILCYIIGVIGIFIFWYGLGAVFPRGADILSYALRYLRYTLIGLWVSAVAPLVFQRLGLNSSHLATSPDLQSHTT